MYNIVIGIPTYQRPFMLEKLIRSIMAIHLDRKLVEKIDVLVVDNDLDQTAAAVVKALMTNSAPPFSLHYHKFEVKGLSNVRNEIIAKAITFKPDFIVFIDDDEYVTQEWLNELILTIQSNNGDFALGPVIPQFKRGTPVFITRWFGYPEFEDQQQLDFFYTGNLIMRTRFLVDKEMAFDPRFNTTGGEDYHFGLTAFKKGAIINWAGKAIAYETIPENRASLKWLIRRRYRGAITYTYITLAEKRYGLILKKFFVSFLYLFIGCLSLVLTPFRVEYRYFGLLKIAEGVGGFAGMLNLQYHEYS